MGGALCRIGIRGAWIVIYVSAMMFVFRHFAGPIAHRLSNLTMLWGSAALAVLGLWILPLADSPVTGFLALDDLDQQHLFDG